jgi:ribonuclease HIII
MTDYYVVEPCTTAKGFEIKLKNKTIDLAKAEGALSTIGEIVGSSGVVLLVKMKGLSLSVYASGRMMVKGKKASQKEADELASEICAALKSTGAIL